jgi:hypothetical protein
MKYTAARENDAAARGHPPVLRRAGGVGGSRREDRSGCTVHLLRRLQALVLLPTFVSSPPHWVLPTALAAAHRPQDLMPVKPIDPTYLCAVSGAC